MYLNNLSYDITELQAHLDETLDQLKPCQREIVRGVLEILKAALGKIGDTNYGCCQEVCVATTCWDAPEGISDVNDSAYIVSLSNIGIEKKVSPAEIQKWWDEDGENCQFTKTVLTELGVGGVTDLLDFDELFGGVTPPSEVILLVGLVALAYVVLGDPIILLHNTETLLSDDNLENLISTYLPDWRDQLESLMQNVSTEFALEPDGLLQLIRWLFTDFQNTFNQVNVLDGDDPCGDNDYGLQFPSWPSILWLIVNAALGVVGSFLIAKESDKFGDSGVAPIGPNDPNIDWRLTHHTCEGGNMYLTQESPLNPFKILRIEAGSCDPLVGEPRQLRVKFSQKIHNEGVLYGDFLPVIMEAITGEAQLRFQKSMDQGQNWMDILGVVNANEPDYFTVAGVPGDEDTIVIDLIGMQDGFGCGDLVRGYWRNTEFNGHRMPHWTGDKCSSFAWKNVPVIGGVDESGDVIEWEHTPIYPTIQDTILWACESVGEDGESGITLIVQYIISWWLENYGTEFNQAISILQGLGLLNGKGSVFAGFLHPDAMCSPYLESIICRFLLEDCDDEEMGLRNELIANQNFPKPLYDEDGDGINDDLPDTVEIGNCPDVNIPPWLRSWYEEYRHCLYLKLPYDPCNPNDCVRYTRDEQLCLLQAIYSLIDAFIDSTPFGIGFGFEDWPNMKRYMSVVPVARRQVDLLTPDYAGWQFGCLPNPNILNLPYQDEVCVECCEIIACECCGNYPCSEEHGEGGDDVDLENCGHLPEDCCDCAVGAWSENTSYPQGIIISHDVPQIDFMGQPVIVQGDDGWVTQMEEACFEALKDTCAPDANPEPGTVIAETYWKRCTPVCILPGNVFQINSINCDYDCIGDQIDAGLNDFEESSEVFAMINYTGCDPTACDPLYPDLPSPTPANSCEFDWRWILQIDQGGAWGQPIEVRRNQGYYPAAYPVALGEHPGDGGQGNQYYASKNYRVVLQAKEVDTGNIIDSFTNDRHFTWHAFYSLKTGDCANMEPLPCGWDEDDVCCVELYGVDSSNIAEQDNNLKAAWNSFVEDHDGGDNQCEYAWVYEVYTDNGDQVNDPEEIRIPYWGGVGTKAANITVGAIRNPYPALGGDTEVHVKLWAYPASYAELIQVRLDNWDCTVPEYWQDGSDGFDWEGWAKESPTQQLTIPCYCTPTVGGNIGIGAECFLGRGGQDIMPSATDLLGGGDENANLATDAVIPFVRILGATHILPDDSNGCQGSWQWIVYKPNGDPANIGGGNTGENALPLTAVLSDADPSGTWTIELRFCPEMVSQESPDVCDVPEDLWSVQLTTTVEVPEACCVIPFGMSNPTGAGNGYAADQCAYNAFATVTYNHPSDYPEDDDVNGPQIFIDEDPHWNFDGTPLAFNFTASSLMSPGYLGPNCDNLPVENWRARWTALPVAEDGSHLPNVDMPQYEGDWSDVLDGLPDLTLTPADLAALGDGYDGVETWMHGQPVIGRIYHIELQLQIAFLQPQTNWPDDTSVWAPQDSEATVTVLNDPAGVGDVGGETVYTLLTYRTLEHRVCKQLEVVAITVPDEDSYMYAPDIDVDPNDGTRSLRFAPIQSHSDPGSFSRDYTLVLDTSPPSLDTPIEVPGSYNWSVGAEDCAVCEFNVGFLAAECEIIPPDGSGDPERYISRFPLNTTIAISTECGVSHDDPNLVVEVYPTADEWTLDGDPILTLANGDLEVNPDPVSNCWQVNLTAQGAEYRYEFDWTQMTDLNPGWDEDVIADPENPVEVGAPGALFTLLVRGTDNAGEDPVTATASAAVLDGNEQLNFNDHFRYCWDGNWYCINEECPEEVVGCMDPDSCNYDDTANSPAPCFYTPAPNLDQLQGFPHGWLDDLGNVSGQGAEDTLFFYGESEDWSLGNNTYPNANTIQWSENPTTWVSPLISTGVHTDGLPIISLDLGSFENGEGIGDDTHCVPVAFESGTPTSTLIGGIYLDALYKEHDGFPLIEVTPHGEYAYQIFDQSGAAYAVTIGDNGELLFYARPSWVDNHTGNGLLLEGVGTESTTTVRFKVVAREIGVPDEYLEDCKDEFWIEFNWDEPVYGVLDETACNYAPLATVAYGMGIYAPDNDVTFAGAVVPTTAAAPYIAPEVTIDDGTKTITVDYSSLDDGEAGIFHRVDPIGNNPTSINLTAIAGDSGETLLGIANFTAIDADNGASYRLDDSEFGGHIKLHMHAYAAVTAPVDYDVDGDDGKRQLAITGDAGESLTKTVVITAMNPSDDTCNSQWTLYLRWNDIPGYGVTDPDACNYSDIATISYGTPAYTPVCDLNDLLLTSGARPMGHSVQGAWGTHQWSELYGAIDVSAADTWVAPAVTVDTETNTVTINYNSTPPSGDDGWLHTVPVEHQDPDSPVQVSVIFPDRLYNVTEGLTYTITDEDGLQTGPFLFGSLSSPLDQRPSLRIHAMPSWAMSLYDDADLPGIGIEGGGVGVPVTRTFTINAEGTDSVVPDCDHEWTLVLEWTEPEYGIHDPDACNFDGAEVAPYGTPVYEPQFTSIEAVEGSMNGFDGDDDSINQDPNMPVTIWQPDDGGNPNPGHISIEITPTSAAGPDPHGYWMVDLGAWFDSWNTISILKTHVDGVLLDDIINVGYFDSDEAGWSFLLDGDSASGLDLGDDLVAQPTWYTINVQKDIGAGEGGACNTVVKLHINYTAPVAGCMDEYSCNYDASATVDNGSCIPAPCSYPWGAVFHHADNPQANYSTAAVGGILGGTFNFGFGDGATHAGGSTVTYNDGDLGGGMGMTDNEDGRTEKFNFTNLWRTCGEHFSDGDVSGSPALDLSTDISFFEVYKFDGNVVGDVVSHYTGVIGNDEGQTWFEAVVGGLSGIQENTRFAVYVAQRDDEGNTLCQKFWTVDFVYTPACNWSVDINSTSGGFTCDTDLAEGDYSISGTMTTIATITWDQTAGCLEPSGIPSKLSNGANWKITNVLDNNIIFNSGSAGQWATSEGVAYTLNGDGDPVAITITLTTGVTVDATLTDLNAGTLALPTYQVTIEEGDGTTQTDVSASTSVTTSDYWSECSDVDGNVSYVCIEEECPCDIVINSLDGTADSTVCSDNNNSDSNEATVDHNMVITGDINYSSSCSLDSGVVVAIHTEPVVSENGANIIDLVDEFSDGQASFTARFPHEQVWTQDMNALAMQFYITVFDAINVEDGVYNSADALYTTSVTVDITRAEADIDCICGITILTLENALEPVTVFLLKGSSCDDMGTGGSYIEGPCDFMEFPGAYGAYPWTDSGHILTGANEWNSDEDEFAYGDKTGKGAIMWNVDTSRNWSWPPEVSDAAGAGNETINIYNVGDEGSIEIEGEHLPTVHMCNFGTQSMAYGSAHLFIPAQIFRNREALFDGHQFPDRQDGYASLEVRVCGKWREVVPVPVLDTETQQPTDCFWHESIFVLDDGDPGNGVPPVTPQFNTFGASSNYMIGGSVGGGVMQDPDGGQESWRPGWVQVGFLPSPHEHTNPSGDLDEGQYATCHQTDFQWVIYLSTHMDEGDGDTPYQQSDVLFRVTLNDPTAENCSRYYLLISSDEGLQWHEDAKNSCTAGDEGDTFGEGDLPECGHGDGNE